MPTKKKEIIDISTLSVLDRIASALERIDMRLESILNVVENIEITAKRSGPSVVRDTRMD